MELTTNEMFVCWGGGGGEGVRRVYQNITEP